MAAKHRILVTGAAGAIGRVICPALRARGHVVRGLDLVDPAHVVDEPHVGSIADAAAVDRAVAGVDAVVHLAAEPWECDFLTRLLPSNFVGVYHVLDAARRHATRRVVLASSVHAVMGLWDDRRIVRLADGTAPRTQYGVSKVFAEQLGQMFAHTHGLSVIAVRIGWFTRNAEEVRRCRDRGWQGMFFSHRDAADFFARCVETPDVTYEVLFATSRHPPGGPGLDLEPARRVLGYQPSDVFPNGLSFELPRDLRTP